MERNTNLNNKFEMFSCSNCGNTNFEQECFVKSHEIVNIHRNENKEMSIVSIDLKTINQEDIEYNNEFMCIKCNTYYDIINIDGVDTIIQIGAENNDE